jgi:hypothetical protein
MVASYPERRPDAMVSRMPGLNPPRLPPGESITSLTGGDFQPGPTDFNIEIRAKDGALLLRLFERGGRLACETEGSRLEEGTKAFLYQMLQWSGQAGIRWKDEVRKAAEDGS